jgi:hypothetical protein
MRCAKTDDVKEERREREKVEERNNPNSKSCQAAHTT